MVILWVINKVKMESDLLITSVIDRKAGVWFVYHNYDYRLNNIQATISAVWLSENMSINPKSVNSAISPVQKCEIECKTVKSSAKL